MANDNTLISLAMLKSSIDAKKDYLERLRPFIMDALFKQRPEVVSDYIVSTYLKDMYGLVIPQQVTQILLQRIARDGCLVREHGVYRIVNLDESVQLDTVKATEHIGNVINGLIRYSSTTVSPIESKDEAINQLIAFLSEFSIPCVKYYLRNTALPDIANTQGSENVLVANYVIYISENEHELYSSFLVMLQGHMLANSLVCPSLSEAPKSYKNVTFFFDTRLILALAGLDGNIKKHATLSLCELIRKLHGTMSVFSHTMEEVQRVITVASDFIDSTEGRGSIVREARMAKRTKSDLLLIAADLEIELANINIKVQPTPRYHREYQIDETMFENILTDEIDYYNQKAIEYDVNTVRSIYALRERLSPNTIERCRAVAVTSNTAFANAAYQYGQKYLETSSVSSVITDFSLANMAWLKTPMESPQIPQNELIAFAYTAHQPTRRFIEALERELDKLEHEGRMTERHLQLLRSRTESPELMRYTLGREESLNYKTMTEIAENIEKEIKEEEKRLRELRESELNKIIEEKSHILDMLTSNQRETYDGVKKDADKISSRYSLIASIFIAIISLGVVLFVTFYPNYEWYFMLPIWIAYVVIAYTPMINGVNICVLHKKIKESIYKRYIKKMERRLRVKLLP